ncbi:MAG: thiamine diphosphokinase [Anaerolineales bacterium]
MNRILIFANGELPDLEKTRALLLPEDFILCADGGTHHALALGLTPNVIMGDFDSFDINRSKMDVKIIQFPRDKNETDLELTIQYALDLNPKQIVIIGALGGRLDQTLGNLALLTDSKLSACDIRLDDGVEEILFCKTQAKIQGRSGDLLSLIPWGGEVTGVETENLKWPLFREVLYPNKTRGISNEMLGDEASIKIDSGNVLIVHRRMNH